MSVNRTVSSALGARVALAGEVLLDLADERLDVAGEREVVVAGQLDEARALDVLGVVEGVPAVDERVPLAAHDERRGLHLRELRARVVPGGHLGELAHPPRAGRNALEPADPRAQPQVAGGRRRQQLGVAALAPGRELLVEARAALGLALQPGQVVVAHGGDHRRVEDERARALGPARRPDGRELRAADVAHERRALAPRRVEHGLDVGELVDERPGAGRHVRQAGAAAVHEDQARDLREPVASARPPAPPTGARGATGTSARTAGPPGRSRRTGRRCSARRRWRSACWGPRRGR